MRARCTRRRRRASAGWASWPGWPSPACGWQMRVLLPVMLAAFALAALSVLDDVRGLPVALRFLAHFVAAAACLLALGLTGWALVGRGARRGLDDQSVQLHGRRGRAGGRHGRDRLRRAGAGGVAGRCAGTGRRCARRLRRRRWRSCASTFRRRGCSWATPDRSRWGFWLRRSALWARSRRYGRGCFRCWCFRRSSSMPA